MQAGKVVDSHGLQKDYSIEQADAEQAYIQADLKGKETWILLPEEAWPDLQATQIELVFRMAVNDFRDSLNLQLMVEKILRSQ